MIFFLQNKKTKLKLELIFFNFIGMNFLEYTKNETKNSACGSRLNFISISYWPKCYKTMAQRGTGK